MSTAAEKASLAQPPAVVNMANQVEPKEPSLSDAKPPKDEEKEAEQQEKSGGAKDYFVSSCVPLPAS